MHWVELDSLLHREVQHSLQSVQSPGDHSLFFQGFLRSSCQSISSCWSTMALMRDCGLLLGTEVQLIVSCTTIEAQIVFKMFFALVTSQLAIADQLGREVYPQSIGLLLGSREWGWLRGKVLGEWGCWRWICLVLGGYGRAGGGSFSLLPGVRLKGLFLCLPYTMAFTVLFPVVVINGYC